jgi:hypothetical protein
VAEGWIFYIPILRRIVTPDFYEAIKIQADSPDPAVSALAGRVLGAMDTIAAIGHD